MKRFIKTIVILIVIILLPSAVYIYQCRNLSLNIEDINGQIFVPQGMADSYENLLKFSIDEHYLWEYRLNNREKEKAENDLENSVWKEFDGYAKEETEYLSSPDYKDISNNSHYCIYDFSLKKFIGIDEDVALLGWRRALFIYDKENARYYCVIKSI